MKRAKGYTFTRGRKPHGEGLCDFKIPTDLVDRFMRYGPAHKFWDLYAIPHVLQNPAGIFEGLEREEQQSGLCYAGVPPFIRREPKLRTSQPDRGLDVIQLPPPAGMTFAVFVNVDYVIFDWRWEEMDVNNPGYPTDWQLRFTKRLWPI